MAQVFDNGMTAHVWAAQEQHAGRSHNGNFYFEGRSIYSYGTHFVAGYVAPGPLYLVNSDDSTMTTKCKHLPAVWRAIDYGRGKYSNHTGVPDLGSIASIFDRLDSGYVTKAEAQQALARHMESDARAWPGQEAATLIYRAAGMTGPKAFAKAKAGQKRVATAEEKRRADAERAAQARDLRAAKYYAAEVSPESMARETRETLAEAAAGAAWQQERKEAEARDNLKEYFRAAKAAKAKGWTRIAAHCRACYQAGRAEIRAYESNAARWQYRAAIAAHIETVRTAPADLTQTGKSATDTAAQRAARAAGLGRLCGSLCESLVAIAESGFATRKAGLMKEAGKAAEMRDRFNHYAATQKQEAQAEARAAWLAGGNAPAWGQGRLEDSEGGALLRAEAIERDDSGAIVGGLLRTSWAATVPLAHAIRAFQFLKLCRDRGQGWAANGRTIRVGHFRIDSVDARGNFVAGCHRINWQEVARLAALLGVADLASDDSALVPSRGAA